MVCVFTNECAWVCVRFFFPPYGCDLVICNSMLAYLYSSGFPLVCGFLVCVDKMYFGCFWLSPSSNHRAHCRFFLSVTLTNLTHCWSCHLKKKNFPLTNTHKLDLKLQSLVQCLLLKIGCRGQLRTPVRLPDMRTEAIRQHDVICSRWSVRVHYWSTLEVVPGPWRAELWFGCSSVCA